MKDSAEYAECLKKLCNRLQRSGGKVVVPESADVTTELVWACLSKYTTENKTRVIMNRLLSHFVDLNEVRVSRTTELMDVIGKNFGQVREVTDTILKLLRSVFNRQDSLDMNGLKEIGKREAKAFLEELEGACPYVVSRVMMRALGAHAFPVHDSMLTMLRGEEVVNLKSDLAEVQGFLERQIPAQRVQKVYALLRRHADNYKGKNKVTQARKKTRKRTRTTKKKTTKKTATKKKTR
jgi:endonuclease III